MMMALVRPAMQSSRILAAGERRLHLAAPLGDGDEPRLGRAVRCGELGVLDAHATDAGRLQLLDRAA